MEDTDNEGDFSKMGNSENSINNIDSLNLDKADLDALRGDIIGDTVYSGKWILKTLISLSKMREAEWSEQLEGDLCLLWDMTAEKDVVLFLSGNDFLSIAERTLKISKEPRLTEIIIGIIGNVCCQPAILEAVANAEELVSVIFRLLSTDDTETLLQIIRFLQTCVWDIHKNPKTKWLMHFKDCKYLGDCLSFILQSSTSGDLLTATVELLQSISNVETPDGSRVLADLIKFDQLVSALVECFNQLIPKDDAVHSRADFKFIENWLTIFTSAMQSKLEISYGESSEDSITKVMQVILKILQPYVNHSNLFPLEKRLAFCIHDCVETTSWLRRNKYSTDLRITCTIITILRELRSAIKEDACEDGEMDVGEAEHLTGYLETYCYETLPILSETEILEVSQLCDSDAIQCLIDVAKEHCKECPDVVTKLLRVQSFRIDR